MRALWLLQFSLLISTFARADFLSELRPYAAKTTYPLTINAQNIDPDFLLSIQSATSKERDENHYQEVIQKYSELQIDPLQKINSFYQRTQWKPALIKSILSRIHADPLQIPGLPKPVQLITNKTAEQILQSDFKSLTLHEKTILLSALSIDTSFPELSQQSLLQTLMAQFHLSLSDFQSVGSTWTDPQHLMIYLPTSEEWTLIMRAVGDPSQMDALGYTAHDPDNHLSLILLQESALNFSETLTVLTHELSHVLQHRFAESNKIDFYATPLNQGLITLLLEGMANDGAYRFFDFMEQKIDAAASGFDFLAAQLRKNLWISETLKDRRLGAQLSRFLFERNLSSSQMYRANLLAVIEKIGINHLFWSLQMPITMPLAKKLLEVDQKFRSPEDQESEIQFAQLQMNQASHDWLYEHLQNYPVLAQAVCQNIACDKLTEESKRKNLQPIAQSGQALFLLEYSRHLSQIQKDWSVLSGGESLSLQQLATPLEKWPLKNRDLWFKYLLTQASFFKTDSLLSELNTQLGFQDSTQQLKITTCTYQELKTCATSASQESDSSGHSMTLIQLRLDGHSDIQLLQSLFHEMTHHIQFQHQDPAIENADPGFTMVSEGLAMWSALALPQVLSDRGLDPYTIEAFHYFGLLELYRQSPNQSYAQFWQAVSLVTPKKGWQEMVSLFFKEINTVTTAHITKEIEKITPLINSYSVF